ncbi:Crp/Fnr family transcriptional regulator [Parasegetibacter sp. NRK P23]|uniref:Crp/Fnr family transcriptional regulator n=1 Tax=Parasegetibacter sp. NRK P23 TaxID=2942999 RepID=UPI002043F7C2|nr:Crp/Fnr family transcriptional regulator [Parasegetibacter sp. NRK P23]MCM5527336.1 Crp/Fnr family transcriptional regulator [Parasegetibacter sp. NRK P23]
MEQNGNNIKAQFPQFETTLLEELEEKAELKSFEAGEWLLRKGQNIRSTMLIISGLVKVFRQDEEGNEYFMYYLEPGQACALSMICAAKQETSQIMAKTVQPTEVVRIPLDNMDAWMAKYKSWYYFVLETYRARFEELLSTVDHIAFRNMDERLVFYLRKYQETTHSNNIHLSFTEMAQELNSSREVISRLMKKLADKGLVRLHKSYVEIVDLGRALG